MIRQTNVYALIKWLLETKPTPVCTEHNSTMLNN